MGNKKANKILVAWRFENEESNKKGRKWYWLKSWRDKSRGSKVDIDGDWCEVVCEIGETSNYGDAVEIVFGKDVSPQELKGADSVQ